jgi:heme/copper-type cytochrome/quinol oxidase subunit 1
VLTAVFAAADHLGIGYADKLARAEAWLMGPAAFASVLVAAHLGIQPALRRWPEYEPAMEQEHRLLTALAVALAPAGVLLFLAFIARRGRSPLTTR